VTKSKTKVKKIAMIRRLSLLLCFAALTGPVAGATFYPIRSEVIISVRDQKLMLLYNGARVAVYPVSTSKYGVGDFWGRMTTPLGYMQVAQKIGDRAPIGAVFHNRRFTGEVLQPNAPGRDPVITRIIWLRGLESQNAHAYARCIYIHGTPQEKSIGRPASYGCIRMRSKDVAALYTELPVGALVQVVQGSLPHVPKAAKPAPNALADGKPAKAPEDWITSARSSGKSTSARRKNIVVAQNRPGV
jgi:lipoprotein-anchoring transpeptidase ErfK/SrfK